MHSPHTNYFLETGGIQIQEDRPLLQAGPQLEEALQGEGWDMGHAPALPAILHRLLELHPPARGDARGQWQGSPEPCARQQDWSHGPSLSLAWGWHRQGLGGSEGAAGGLQSRGRWAASVVTSPFLLAHALL